MSKIAFQIKSIPPFREVTGRFAKATQGLLKDKQALMKDEGRRFVVLAREEAPKGRSGTGKFAKGISFKTFRGGSDVGFRVFVPMPLGRYILEGTRAHRIAARNVKALKFLWEKGPRSSNTFTVYHFYKSVMHPGTKPNPFMSRAYRRWIPGARTGLNRISKNYIRTIMGAKQETAKF